MVFYEENSFCVCFLSQVNCILNMIIYNGFHLQKSSTITLLDLTNQIPSVINKSMTCIFYSMHYLHCVRQPGFHTFLLNRFQSWLILAISRITCSRLIFQTAVFVEYNSFCIKCFCVCKQQLLYLYKHYGLLPYKSITNVIG